MRHGNTRMATITGTMIMERIRAMGQVSTANLTGARVTNHTIGSMSPTMSRTIGITGVNTGTTGMGTRRTRTRRPGMPT